MPNKKNQSGNQQDQTDGEGSSSTLWNVLLGVGAATVMGVAAYAAGYNNGQESCQSAMRTSTGSGGRPQSTSTTSGGSSNFCDHPDKQYPVEKCAICLSKIKPTKVLNCGHVFHDECSQKWVEVQGTCPICRASQ